MPIFGLFSLRTNADGTTDLLVSCTNDDSRGGIYHVRGRNKEVDRVYVTPCMGLVKFGAYYIIASQSVEVSGQPEDGFSRNHSIVCLNSQFETVSEAPVSGLGMGDLHDVMVVDGTLYVVDTKGNRVVAFEIARLSAVDSLPLGDQSITPVREWSYAEALEPDACHVNSICLMNGRLYAAVFGPFKRYREYESRGYDGQVLDITDGFVPFGDRHRSPSAPIVLSGLADPHSLTATAQGMMLAESRVASVRRGQDVVARFSSGYIRGLLLEDHLLWVGHSGSRHALTLPHASGVLLFNLHRSQIESRIEIPAREIYSIIRR
jgi:hypothetical protein